MSDLLPDEREWIANAEAATPATEPLDLIFSSLTPEAKRRVWREFIVCARTAVPELGKRLLEARKTAQIEHELFEEARNDANDLQQEVLRARAEIERLRTPRMFPIQSQRGAKPHPLMIPWAIAELAYSVYSQRYGREQSLEGLAERAGFGPGEMDDFLPDWRERCDALAESRRELQRVEQDYSDCCADRAELRQREEELVELLRDFVAYVRLGYLAGPWPLSQLMAKAEALLKDHSKNHQ